MRDVTKGGSRLPESRAPWNEWMRKKIPKSTLFPSVNTKTNNQMEMGWTEMNEWTAKILIFFLWFCGFIGNWQQNNKEQQQRNNNNINKSVTKEKWCENRLIGGFGDWLAGWFWLDIISFSIFDSFFFFLFFRLVRLFGLAVTLTLCATEIIASRSRRMLHIIVHHPVTSRFWSKWTWWSCWCGREREKKFNF